MTNRTGRDTRPEHEEGNAHPSLIGVLLASLERSVVRVGKNPTVVGVEDDVGVLNEFVSGIAGVIGFLE